ncbi:MAG: uroporphyrinogen decarboxylase family protein [Planctomycetota bacterium]
MVLGREFEGLGAAEQERALRTNAEILLAVSAEMEYAALSGPNGYWEHAPGQLAYYVLPGEARFRQLRVLRDMAPRDLVLVGNTGGVLGASYSDEFCYQMFHEPEKIDQRAADTYAHSLENAKKIRDAGAEIAVSASDIADNSGPFFNPKQMERWILPYLTKWSEAMHAMGLRTILHTDGNLTEYMDQIADTGLDAVQAIDPTVGMDMRATRDIVGDRLGLCGNIDCGKLLMGKPEDIFKAPRDLLASCKDDGGLVLGASNAVQPDVPIANYRAMIAAWREFGRY